MKLQLRMYGKESLMKRVIAIGAIALLAIANLAGVASAVSYADQMDPTGTVFYENISDLHGLYGAPTVSLNSLDFTPPSFRVECSNCGDAGALTTDTVTLDIRAIAGQQISEIRVNEGLDYSLQAIGSTAAFASIFAKSDIFIDILEINGVSVNNINASLAMGFDPADNASVFGPTGFGSGIITGTTGAIDIAQIIANAGGPLGGEATLVRISLDNSLSAFHSGSGQASLRKRDADFVSITINGGSPIPEPSTALLVMGGLALLGWWSRSN